MKALQSGRRLDPVWQRRAVRRPAQRLDYDWRLFKVTLTGRD